MCLLLFYIFILYWYYLIAFDIIAFAMFRNLYYILIMFMYILVMFYIFLHLLSYITWNLINPVGISYHLYLPSRERPCPCAWLLYLMYSYHLCCCTAVQLSPVSPSRERPGPCALVLYLLYISTAIQLCCSTDVQLYSCTAVQLSPVSPSRESSCPCAWLLYLASPMVFLAPYQWFRLTNFPLNDSCKHNFFS